MADTEFVERLVPELEKLLPMLDERAQRLVLGAVAEAAGDGGTSVVAKATGKSWQTVADGKAELGSGDSAPPGRIRRPGAGRRPLAGSDEGLIPALRELAEATTRGDPMSPLRWTVLSVRQIAAQLTARGHRCGKNVVARLLAAEGYSLQGSSRTLEGKRHPDRDAQFRYIAKTVREFLAAGDPVISVDAKKKEQVGLFGQKGRTWRRRGDPVRVRDHDFKDRDTVTAIPYGIYDVAANEGFVNVGTDHDTAAFAVESIRRWRDEIGSLRYPGARRLLITCDAGGSNSYRTRGWKAGLAALAAETGLVITVLHFPPGTSKWNKIEHRLFCHISRTWRARPLESCQVIIDTIAATTTAAGLTVTARLDLGSYPEGTQVSDQHWRYLDEHVIARHSFHGDWNYDVRPAAAPAAPAPPAAPAEPGILAVLAQTARSRQDIDALAAALEVPFAAAREQRRYLARGRPRSRDSGPPGPLRHTLTDRLHIAICRYQLGVTSELLAQLTGIHPSDISRYASPVARLLTSIGKPLTPAPRRIRTLTSLHAYAEAAAITLPAHAHTSPAGHTSNPQHAPNSP